VRYSYALLAASAVLGDRKKLVTAFVFPRDLLLQDVSIPTLLINLDLPESGISCDVYSGAKVDSSRRLAVVVIGFCNANC
jgi:hypothetical protein